MWSPARMCVRILVKATLTHGVSTLIFKVFAVNDWTFGKSLIILQESNQIFQVLVEKLMESCQAGSSMTDTVDPLHKIHVTTKRDISQ